MNFKTKNVELSPKHQNPTSTLAIAFKSPERQMISRIACPDCGSNLIPSSGCSYCPICGWSRCS